MQLSWACTRAFACVCACVRIVLVMEDNPKDGDAGVTSITGVASTSILTAIVIMGVVNVGPQVQIMTMQLQYTI